MEEFIEEVNPIIEVEEVEGAEVAPITHEVEEKKEEE